MCGAQSICASNFPVVSKLTCLESMTPIGPSLSSIRSIGRSKVELDQNYRRQQRNLSRLSKEAVLKSIERIGVGAPKLDEPPEDLLDSRMPTHRELLQESQASMKNQAILEKLYDKEQRVADDERVAKLKAKLAKLSQEDQEKKKSQQMLLQKSSSRQTIIPGA